MEEFINILCTSDRYIEDIFSRGGCYQFHLILKHLFPECQPWINKDADHVVSLYKEEFYDITGKIDGEYFPMLVEEIQDAKLWSFSKTMMLQITECPVCEEPICI